MRNRNPEAPNALQGHQEQKRKHRQLNEQNPKVLRRPRPSAANRRHALPNHAK